MKLLYLLLSFFVLTSSFTFPDGPDDIVGTWKDGNGKGHIQIFKQQGKYYGKIVWLKDAKNTDGKPKVDRKNPNTSLRTRPIVGIVMLRDFKYDDGEWTNGYIYNPSDGKEYKAYMKLKDKNTLAVRGYVGISLIGKTDTWLRVK